MIYLSTISENGDVPEQTIKLPECNPFLSTHHPAITWIAGPPACSRESPWHRSLAPRARVQTALPGSALDVFPGDLS